MSFKFSKQEISWEKIVYSNSLKRTLVHKKMYFTVSKFEFLPCLCRKSYMWNWFLIRQEKKTAIVYIRSENMLLCCEISRKWIDGFEKCRGFYFCCCFVFRFVFYFYLFIYSFILFIYFFFFFFGGGRLGFFFATISVLSSIFKLCLYQCIFFLFTVFRHPIMEN